MAIYKCSYSDNGKPEFWSDIEAGSPSAAALIFLGDWDAIHIDGENETVCVHFDNKTTVVQLTLGWVVAK